MKVTNNIPQPKDQSYIHLITFLFKYLMIHYCKTSNLCPDVEIVGWEKTSGVGQPTTSQRMEENKNTSMTL